MDIYIRPDLIEKLEKLYQKDIAWCLEAGVPPRADITAYINYQLFKACEEELDFFNRRDLFKDAASKGLV